MAFPFPLAAMLAMSSLNYNADRLVNLVLNCCVFESFSTFLFRHRHHLNLGSSTHWIHLYLHSHRAILYNYYVFQYEPFYLCRSVWHWTHFFVAHCRSLCAVWMELATPI